MLACKSFNRKTSILASLSSNILCSTRRIKIWFLSTVFLKALPYKTAVWQNSSRVSALSPEIFLIFWSCSPYVCWLRCTMFQPTLYLSSLNELVGQVLRSQQSEMGLLEQLVWKRRIGFIFSSIIMYKSPTTFMKGCTKVKSHKWICDVKRVRHVGRKREKKDAKGHLA